MAQVALTIAGSDCSSGAGIQADLKTFSTLGVHGLTAVTCVVAETPHQVGSITPIPPAALYEQIQLVAKAYPIGAIKTGMLFSAEHVEATVKAIKNSSLSVAHIVVDPVMASSTGESLMKQELVGSIKEQLLPLATVVTPNLPEAEILLDLKIEHEEALTLSAKELAQKYDIACLLKGGHFENSEECVDYLAFNKEIKTFSLPWIDISSSHGTGCTLSAALAANLAKGQTLPTAVKNAKNWLHKALKNSLHWHVDGVDTLCINQAEI